MRDQRQTVVHLLTSLGFGGVERRMQIIGAHQHVAMMRHIFMAINHGGATEQQLRALGAEVICLNKSEKIPNVSAIKSLIRQFREIRPLVVHTHGCEANFHGLVAAFATGVPVRVGEEIGVPKHSSRAQLCFRWAFRCAQRVVAMSRPVADTLLSFKEVPAEKIQIIHSPVRLPQERSEKPTSKALRLCFVGRLEAVKNPIALIKTMEILRENALDVELWVIGDGSQRSWLENEARSRGVLEQITFWGYQEKPEDYVRRCDLYVQPSLSEGFSQSLIEAMGCAVPVVVTPTGGAVDVVEKGVNGWITSGLDDDAIGETVLAALRAGRDKLFEMGRAARKLVEGKYEAEMYIRNLEEVYFKIYSDN